MRLTIKVSPFDCNNSQVQSILHEDIFTAVFFLFLHISIFIAKSSLPGTHSFAPYCVSILVQIVYLYIRIE